MSLPTDSASVAPSLSSSPASNHQTRALRLCIRVTIAFLAFLGLMTSIAQAQPAQFTQGSLSSNTMTLAVPLVDYPGRGGSLPVSLHYSSKVWRVDFLKSVFASSSLRRSVTEVMYAENSVAGWTTSLNVPKVEWPGLDDRYWHDGKPYTSGAASSSYRVAQVFIHMPDGSTHELREFDQVYQNTGIVDMIGTFWAVDGSRMRYDSTGATTGTLYLPDGTRYILNGANAQYIDRNGNTLNYDGATREWRDTLDRHIGMPLPVSPSVGDFPYAMPGLGGPITYTFKWRNLSDVLTVAQSLQSVGDHFLPDPGSPPTNWNSFNFPQPTGAPGLFNSGEVPVVPMEPNDPDTSFIYVVGRGQVGSNVFNPVVLSEIVLPNGLSYKFTYNIYGEIDKVVYPKGSYQRYQYAQVAGLTSLQFPYAQANRGITFRWVSPNGTGGSDESQWQYQASISSDFSFTVITVTAPNGTRTESYLHRSSATNTFGYGDARVGMPAEVRVFAPAAQGGAMLRRTLTDYAWSFATFNRPSPSTGSYTAKRNARPVKTVSLILDTGGNALTSTTTSEYDTTYEFTVGSDQTLSEERGFTTVDQTSAQTGAITTIPLGPLVRKTETAFLTSNANYRNRNILGLVTLTVVKNATDTIVSQKTLSYDEAQYPLFLYGPVTHWIDPQHPYRGNVTTASSWLDFPSPVWIATHTQYDQCGSVVKSWDANGNLSQVTYSPAFAFAYPTQTTTPVPDPSGTFGSTTALVASTDYDFNTGLVTSTIDTNGKTTTFEYNDPLNRMRKVNRPDGGWTITNYDDTVGSTRVHTQTLRQSSPTQETLDTFQFFDKMGRSVRTFVNEGTTYLTSDTQYDNLGRLWRVSNPYRTTAFTDTVNPSGLWTINTYDALSRVTAVTTPDGAQVVTSYAAVTTGSIIGPTATVTDPAGKTRKSISDAQSRMIQVIEDPNGVAYQTNYDYDVLNNLRKIEQGVQFRYFGYDSLSRLIRVRHVEQTVNSAITNPVTGYSGGWTMGMSYDNNGNVITRRDARNVVTTYAYDALNRNTTVRYTDGTKDIDRHYDGAINGKGRFWYSNWDPNDNTRFDSHCVIDEYDAIGRPKNYRHHFFTNGVASQQFNLTRTYDLAGNIKTQTYPSGHTVSYSYDTAGRFNSYSGNLGDGVSRTYSTGVSYSEFGGLQQEQFGTQITLYHKLHYNMRGQLFDTRLSSLSWTQDQWNWNRGALVNYFSANYSWGGSGTDNNGNITLQQHWVPTDDSLTNYWYSHDKYFYDTLNRLSSTNEIHGGPWGQSNPDFAQAYEYDRYGNRKVDQNLTTTNVPRPNFTVDPNTNQLIAPAGFNYSYDAAGNLVNDTYTSYGRTDGTPTRLYDAENRLTTAKDANLQVVSSYSYNAEGKRTRRKVSGVETWQVHGLGGELMAEYKSGAAPFLPSREYGYRGGQMLVMMSSGDDARLTRFVYNLYYGALQRDPTSQELQDKVNQLAAAGLQSQSQLLTTAKQIARSLFIATAFETSPYRSDVQYVTDLYYTYLQRGPDDGGLGWWVSQVPGSGRENVLNAFEASSEFATIVSTLYGTATSDNQRTEAFVNNFYLAALGRFATPTELQQQRDALNAAAAQGVSQVQAQAESFGRTLFAAQINDASLSNTQYVTNLYEGFLQRGPDAGGLGWWSGQATLGQGRQNVLDAFAVCIPFRELSGTLYREAFWLVTDRLGTPRMIVSKAGTLAGVKRHDYLPFGEELTGGIGGRTPALGYTGDSVRQKFTSYEADAETSLNFAQARYQSSLQGRFTSVDPLEASADEAEPQSFNRYSYALNNPTNLTDPDGMMPSAGQSWGDVAGLFWGSSFNFGTPPTQNHIAEALARHDSIITTGYDPAFGHYRGQVEVEYIANEGFVATTTLNNPTPEELGQTMDFMANSSDLLANKGPRGVRRSGRNSSPKSDPKNWTWVPAGRGRGYWHYSGSGAFGIPPRPTGRTPGFVGGVRVEHHGRVIYQGIVDLRSTFARVQRGRNGLLRSYPHDGSLFFNREGLLPQQFPGYYREYVIPSPGITGAGPQRLVVGLGGEAYYTPNHYRSFVSVGTIPNYPTW